MTIRNSLIQLTLAAIFVRILIMPFLFHPDIKSHYYHANFLSEGITNIYRYIDQNKKYLEYQDTFNYPPLTYFTFGVYSLVVKNVVGENYQNWLTNWKENWHTNSEIFKILFALKIPYLILDILTGLLIIKFLKSEYKKRALIIWFFNPINIYLLYGMANFDIILGFLNLAALFLFKEKKHFLSGLLLGASVSFKLFPILLYPFFVAPLVFNTKPLKGLFFTLGFVILPLITMQPFSNEITSLGNSGLIAKFFEFKLGLFGTYIPFVLIYYPVIFLFYFYQSLGKEILWERLNLYLTVLILGLLSFTNYHPQWLIWVLPFLTILVAQNLKLLIFLIPLILSFVMHVISFEDRFLTLGILSPILPGIYDLDSIDKTIFARVDKSLFVKFSSGLFVVSLLFVLLNIKNDFIKLKFKLSEKYLMILFIVMLMGIFSSMIFLSLAYQSKKNIVFSQSEVAGDIPIYKGKSISGKFPNSSNIDLIEIKIKNIDFKNEDKLKLTLKDDSSQIIRTMDLSGRNVGFDDWVRFQQPSLLNILSGNINYDIESETVDESKALRVDINSEKDVAIRVYSKNSLGQTLNSFKNEFLLRFSYDKNFSYFYFSLLLITVILMFKYRGNEKV